MMFTPSPRWRIEHPSEKMIGLLDTVGRLKEFDFPLMLRTPDYEEVQADSKLSFVFQSGIRMTV